MTFQDAIQVVESYKNLYGFPGLLETLEDMQQNFTWLNTKERQAYRVMFAEMGKLFAPA